MELKDKFPKGIEVVVAAIIEDLKGNILLVKQSKWNNKWTFPGGHIEVGETIAQTIIRENKEETGLKTKFIKVVEVGELINSKDFYRPAHFIYIDVWCKTQDKDIKIDKAEIQEYKQVKPEEALKLDLAETFGNTIKKFIDLKNKNIK